MAGGKRKSKQTRFVPPVRLDSIHINIEWLTGADVRERTRGKSYHVSSCVRCGDKYAFASMKNPRYCPACLFFVTDRTTKALRDQG